MNHEVHLRKDCNLLCGVHIEDHPVFPSALLLNPSKTHPRNRGQSHHIYDRDLQRQTPCWVRRNLVILVQLNFGIDIALNPISSCHSEDNCGHKNPKVVAMSARSDPNVYVKYCKLGGELSRHNNLYLLVTNSLFQGLSRCAAPALHAVSEKCQKKIAHDGMHRDRGRMVHHTS